MERVLPARPQRDARRSHRAGPARRRHWSSEGLMLPLTVTLCSATLGDEGQTDPPLGPLYIAAALEEIGVEVDFRDFQLADDGHGLSGEPLARFLSGHAEIVAVSCFVDMLPAVLDATRRLHADRPETRFLLGGPGPTASARRIV